MQKIIEISIIIATYNRANLLKESLESLQNIDAPDLKYEVIVVDNNSKDNTSDVVNEFLKKCRNIKLIKESNQGLSFARNKGIETTRGNILVFIDDDVEIDKGWLRAIIEPFEDQDVWCVGGKVLPQGKSDIPEWLPERLKFLIGLADYGDMEKVLIDKEKPLGCNMAFRKEVFDNLGKFDTNIGRQGKKLLGGEEVDIYYKILKSKKKIVYCPRALVYHKIEDKLRREYVLSSAYWLGVSESYIERKSFKTRFYIKLLRSLLYPIIVHPFMFLFKSLGNMSESDKFWSQYLVRYSLGYLKWKT